MADRSPTILCVDDDPEILEVLREYLTRQGFHVVKVLQAGGGDEALRLILKFRPHIVLLEIKMPRMTGVEALRQCAQIAPIRSAFGFIPALFNARSFEPLVMTRGFVA